MHHRPPKEKGKPKMNKESFLTQKMSEPEPIHRMDTNELRAAATNA